MLSLEWSGCYLQVRCAAGKVEEMLQNLDAGMTSYGITTGLCKVETGTILQGPRLWSANTTEVYDQESG